MRGRFVSSAVISAFLFVIATAPVVVGQGMRTAPSAGGQVDFDTGKLQGADERQIAAVQRLLRRLGHLKDDDVSRRLDPKTHRAISRFLSATVSDAKVSNYDDLLHLLYTSIWQNEGWGKGQAAGQDAVIDPEKVKVSQEALKKLGYELGPRRWKIWTSNFRCGRGFPRRCGHEDRRAFNPQYS